MLTRLALHRSKQWNKVTQHVSISNNIYRKCFNLTGKSKFVNALIKYTCLHIKDQLLFINMWELVVKIGLWAPYRKDLDQNGSTRGSHLVPCCCVTLQKFFALHLNGSFSYLESGNKRPVFKLNLSHSDWDTPSSLLPPPLHTHIHTHLSPISMRHTTFAHNEIFTGHCFPEKWWGSVNCFSASNFLPFHSPPLPCWQSLAVEEDWIEPQTPHFPAISLSQLLSHFSLCSHSSLGLLSPWVFFRSLSFTLCPSLLICFVLAQLLLSYPSYWFPYIVFKKSLWNGPSGGNRGGAVTRVKRYLFGVSPSRRLCRLAFPPLKKFSATIDLARDGIGNDGERSSFSLRLHANAPTQPLIVWKM